MSYVLSKNLVTQSGLIVRIYPVLIKGTRLSRLLTAEKAFKVANTAP